MYSWSNVIKHSSTNVHQVSTLMLDMDPSPDGYHNVAHRPMGPMLGCTYGSTYGSHVSHYLNLLGTVKSARSRCTP
jgi:hypothetical protein